MLRSLLAALVVAAAAVGGDVPLGRGAEDALARLFTLTDRAADDNAAVVAWLRSRGEEGLHPQTHRLRALEVQRELGALAADPLVGRAARHVADALREQLAFFADWERALAEGRAFDSQRHSEFGWHDGLDRSHRALLRAYSDLVGRLPEAGPATRRTLRDRLCAVDLEGPCT